METTDVERTVVAFRYASALLAGVIDEVGTGRAQAMRSHVRAFLEHRLPALLALSMRFAAEAGTAVEVPDILGLLEDLDRADLLPGREAHLLALVRDPVSGPRVLEMIQAMRGSYAAGMLMQILFVALQQAVAVEEGDAAADVLRAMRADAPRQ